MGTGVTAVALSLAACPRAHVAFGRTSPVSAVSASRSDPPPDER